MRSVVIFALLSSISFVMSAQVATNTEMDDSTNIYHQAISILCNNLHDKSESLLVEQNNLTTNSLPSKVGDHKIRIIDIAGLQSLLKKQKGEGIEIVRVIPLRVEKDEFFVNIIFFDAKIKKRQLFFTNKGGYSIVFDYSETDKQFIYREIRD